MQLPKWHHRLEVIPNILQASGLEPRRHTLLSTFVASGRRSRPQSENKKFNSKNKPQSENKKNL